MIKNIFISLLLFLNCSVSAMNLTYTSTYQSLPTLFGYQIRKGYYLEQFRAILRYILRELDKEIIYTKVYCDKKDQIHIIPDNTPFVINLTDNEARICLSPDALPYLEKLRLVHTLGCIHKESYSVVKNSFIEHINSITKFIFIDLPCFEKSNKNNFSDQDLCHWKEEASFFNEDLYCWDDRTLFSYNELKICSYLNPDLYVDAFFKNSYNYNKASRDRYTNFSPEDIFQ